MRSLSAIYAISALICLAPKKDEGSAPAHGTKVTEQKPAETPTKPAATIGNEAAETLISALAEAGIDLATDVTARENGATGALVVKTSALQARFVALTAARNALDSLDVALDKANVELARRYDARTKSGANGAMVASPIKAFRLDARGVMLDDNAPTASVWFDGKTRAGNRGEPVRIYPKVERKAKAEAAAPGAAPAFSSLDD